MPASVPSGKGTEALPNLDDEAELSGEVSLEVCTVCVSAGPLVYASLNY